MSEDDREVEPIVQTVLYLEANGHPDILADAWAGVEKGRSS
jgi:hypothetical protein